MNPALLPVRLLRRHPRLAHNLLAREAFRAVRPLLVTVQPRARLRTVEHRGVTTAAMVYDALPIIDVLRSGGPDLLVGWMDLRGLAQPFFFVLRKDDVS